jgi:hypothetical protein
MYQAVHNVLAIVENLVEFQENFPDIISEKTELVSWLVKRLSHPKFNENKLYASEVLAILTQSSTMPRAKLAAAGTSTSTGTNANRSRWHGGVIGRGVAIQEEGSPRGGGGGICGELV